MKRCLHWPPLRFYGPLPHQVSVSVPPTPAAAARGGARAALPVQIFVIARGGSSAGHDGGPAWKAAQVVPDDEPAALPNSTPAAAVNATEAPPTPATGLAVAADAGVRSPRADAPRAPVTNPHQQGAGLQEARRRCVQREVAGQAQARRRRRRRRRCRRRGRDRAATCVCVTRRDAPRARAASPPPCNSSKPLFQLTRLTKTKGRTQIETVSGRFLTA